MTFKLSTLCAAVLAASGLTVAQAQTGSGSIGPSATPSATAPQGQLSTPNQDKGTAPGFSTATRADVKADTAAAKAAASMPQGQSSTPNQDKGAKPRASSETRADVKADAAAAKKAGTPPKGQESVKDQNKGGVKP